MMQKIYLLSCLFLLSLPNLWGQSFLLEGSVSDEQNKVLPGATILIKGTPRGTTSDEQGNYKLQLAMGDVLIFSYVGYQSKEIQIHSSDQLHVQLTQHSKLEEVSIIGSRNPNRTAMETMVPIDIIEVRDILPLGAQISTSQLLNYIAPSFTSMPQNVADGSDFIDPASLRGMGPDQILVLINGKRRHQSSLVNINGTAGRGSVGTDMDAIPTAAIQRIEILRDGAAAQYGSDAVAGIINIVLRKNAGELQMNVHYGANLSKNSNNLDGGVDGEKLKVDVNYGLPLGKQGGFINLSGEFRDRGHTMRSGAYTGNIFHAYNAVEWVAYQDHADLSSLLYDLNSIQQYAQNVSYFSSALKNEIANASDMESLRNLLDFDVTEAELLARGKTRSDYSMKVGQSEIREGKIFLNLSVPFQKGGEFYAFGGIGSRKAGSFGFYRRPNQERTYTPMYINGFLPKYLADVNDQSLTVGIKGKIKEWHIDFSNVYGKNQFMYSIEGSANASLQSASSTNFDCGGFSFSQNTANLDIFRNWETVLQGFNLALGLEYRLENYQIIAGNDDSWGLYNLNEELIENANTLPESLKVRDFYARLRPGGAQVFPGFRPYNQVNAYRNSMAAYLDLELDWSKNLSSEVAVRYEDYSDFGSTTNFKFASLLKLSTKVHLRTSASSGFRAPSLHQIHFNSVSTLFTNGIGAQVLTASHASSLAKSMGIAPLKEETSMGVSAGITYKIPQWRMVISVDGHYQKIKDRIVLTDEFKKSSFEADGRENLVAYMTNAQAEKVQFFTNAIDTETKGIEAVISQKIAINNSSLLHHDFALALNETKRVGNIKQDEKLIGYEEIYFSEKSEIFLEKAVPQLKMSLSHVFKTQNWEFLLRNVYFGKVTNPDAVEGVYPEYKGKIITDLSFSCHFTPDLKLTLGANNLLDIYPDKTPAAISGNNQFVYPRRVSQFGINGRYVFVQIGFSLL